MRDSSRNWGRCVYTRALVIHTCTHIHPVAIVSKTTIILFKAGRVSILALELSFNTMFALLLKQRVSQPTLHVTVWSNRRCPFLNVSD